MHLHLSDCASLLNQGFAAHCGKNQLFVYKIQLGSNINVNVERK